MTEELSPVASPDYLGLEAETLTHLDLPHNRPSMDAVLRLHVALGKST
ncbi:hypothetical protein [Ensifer sp. 4252]